MMASVEDTVSIADVNSQSQFMGTVISSSSRESSCWMSVLDWTKSLYLEGKWTMRFGRWVRLSPLTTSKFVFVLGTVKLSWTRVV